MCSSGKVPAQATANSVIASAKRLIEVRQVWRRSSRMAEISVPAWPMPIHHTKLTIAKRQQEKHQQRKPDGKTEKPAARSASGQNNGADFLGDRGVAVARPDDRRSLGGRHGR